MLLKRKSAKILDGLFSPFLVIRSLKSKIFLQCKDLLKYLTMLFSLNNYGAFLFRSIKKLYQKTERLNNVDALILTMQVQRAFDILFSLT